jgi:hypothetical protein
LLKDGEPTDPLMELQKTELFAAFSRAAVLRMARTMGSLKAY